MYVCVIYTEKLSLFSDTTMIHIEIDTLCVSLECSQNKIFGEYECHAPLEPNCKTGDKNIAINLYDYVIQYTNPNYYTIS